MYTKDSLNNIYRMIASNIDISDKMFDLAEEEYKKLGKWIDKETPEYQISIYPQGSFALGTVVRPISNEDDYDLDLVCQFEEKYGLTAKEMKVDVVKPLLVKYKVSQNEIEEKRRCWHIEYKDIPYFHMDVIPAYAQKPSIKITDHDEELNTYKYIGSNPSGYVTWFFERCAKQRMRLYEQYVKEHREVVAQAEIEDVKRRKIKTPLQRVVQLLKRHRDIMFKDDQSGNKPISIIITTIAASLYNEEDNIYDAMKNILLNANKWIEDNKREGQYFIENPSYSGENFADKWNTHPERAEMFYNWINQAKRDLIDEHLYDSNRISMGRHIQEVFGENTGKAVFSVMAEKDHKDIKDGVLKVSAVTGALASTGTIKVMANHHHGA